MRREIDPCNRMDYAGVTRPRTARLDSGGRSMIFDANACLGGHC